MLSCCASEGAEEDRKDEGAAADRQNSTHPLAAAALVAPVVRACDFPCARAAGGDFALTLAFPITESSHTFR